MAVGIKAQTVGKGLFIEAKRVGSDTTNQIIIIPNLPNEYGKKSNQTTMYRRNFSPTYSRNSWDYGLTISTSHGVESLASLDEQEEEIERDFYGAPRQRNRWGAEQKKVVISNTDEMLESQRAEAHANMVLLSALDSLVHADNEWSEELCIFTKIDYKVVDSTPLVIPIEITDKDMTDLMADRKLPQAIIRRLMNARKRPI